MVCVSTECCYEIKAGFFLLMTVSPLTIALAESSFFRKVTFLFAFHTMSSHLNAKNGLAFKFCVIL